MDTPNRSLFASIGATPERVLGYLLASVLTPVVGAMVEPEGVKRVVEILGSVAAGLAAFGVGFVIYVIYRRVLGELLLYPLQHRLHGYVDRLRGQAGLEQTSCVGLLESLGVSSSQRRSAYEAIKAHHLPPEQQQRLSLDHGELHGLYIVSVLVGGAGVYAAFAERPHAVVWLVLASVLLACALMADTSQHSEEAALLKSLDRERLCQFLYARGYLERPPSDSCGPLTASGRAAKQASDSYEERPEGLVVRLGRTHRVAGGLKSLAGRDGWDAVLA